MATYFVNPDGGDDGDNGLGPDPTHATNRPWATMINALGTGSAVAPGDTVYLSPGRFLEGDSVAPIAGVSSVASPTSIRGDPQNAQGFRTLGGALIQPGVCWITTRGPGDSSDDPIAPTNFPTIVPAEACHGLRWYDVAFECSFANYIIGCISLSAAGNSDWLFKSCRFQSVNAITYSGDQAATAGRNLTVQDCTILGNAIYFVDITAAATANADLNISFKHNWILHSFSSTTLAFSASGGNLAGGLVFIGNTLLHGQYALSSGCIATVASRVSTVTPIRLQGNIVYSSGIGVQNGTAGHVVSDGYNRFTRAGHANFTPHASDSDGFMTNMAWPDLEKWGLSLPRSDVGAWTDAAHVDQRASAWTNTDPDYRGRTPRPWGAGASIGCFEHVEVAQDATSAITGGGVNSLKVTGAGWILLAYVPVDATGTTIAIITKSTSYGGSNWPRIIALANPSLGINADLVATATSAAEQTVTIASFTPTAKGAVALYGESRSTTVTSTTHFDVLV